VAALNEKASPCRPARAGPSREVSLMIALLSSLGVCLAAGQTAARPSRFAEARRRRRAFGDKLMAKALASPKSHPLVYALAGLRTGRDVAAANERLREAWLAAAGPGGKMTPDLAGAEKVKWCMRGWLRIYYLFNTRSGFFPGRLERDVQAKLEEMFFNYGCRKSTVERARLRHIWFIQGSENHDMMDLSNAYLALQAVKGLAGYRNRRLPDGHTPAEHVAAWEAYYARYALERARNGLFVEISPTYGKWFVGELVNMYEFSADPLVRRRMEMLLHLTWADWAVDQLGGMRGGGKTRVYQGGYSQEGARDSWDAMGRALCGIEGWYDTSHAILSQMALATSRYEPPDVVLDIALDRDGTKSFVYRSVRPAKLVKKPSTKLKEKGYWMDGDGGRMLRYSYWTPNYCMGTWMLDPRLNYAAINTQNRWQGVVFPTGKRARVYPQSVGRGNGKTYNQHVAVQHRNVMMVAHNRNSKQVGQMRVYFPKSFRDRIVERDGWVMLKEGDAWLGVKVLSATRNSTSKNCGFKEGKLNGYWLWPKEDKPPLLFVMSRTGRHRTPGEFRKYLRGIDHSFVGGRALCSFVDADGARTELALETDKPGPPLVNGRPVDLRPEKVFDCPFLDSKRGSGVVTVRKDGSELELDFNAGGR